MGSGPPGAAATVALTNAGVDVTLLEAGFEQDARGLTVRINGLTVIRLHRDLLPRAPDVRVTGDPQTVVYEDIAPGGLTNHWSCAVPRFSRDDFLDARRAGELHTWPLDYDDLSRWYDWVDPYLKISGAPEDRPQLPSSKVADACALTPAWAPIAEAAARAGQAVLPVPYTYGQRTTLTLSGNVFNSFVRMVKPIRRAKTLRVRFGAHVSYLEWSGKTKRVAAVVGRDAKTGAEFRIPCRAVILAAGAINTTRILLHSTSSDFAHGLGNTEGVLGRYLHDHPLGKLEVELDRPLPFDPAAYVTRQPLDRTQPLYAAACLQWSGVRELARSVLKGRPGRSTTCGFSIFGTMVPSATNFVGLDTSGSGAQPGLILNIRHPVESTHALEAARDQLLNFLDAARLKPRVRLWIVDTVGSAIHYAGTCRMHASPKCGMLDRWGRLHAVPNVAVADSAAFTTGPEKNPVLTAMALAARATDRLIEDLRTNII